MSDFLLQMSSRVIAMARLLLALSAIRATGSGPLDFQSTAHCPTGFYRAAPVVFGCDHHNHNDVQVLLSTEPLRMQVPKGVRGFHMKLQAPSGASISIEDPSTSSELASTTANDASVKWQGVNLRLQQNPPQARLEGVLPKNVEVVLKAFAGGQKQPAKMEYSFEDFQGCKPVPVGCSPFERAQARDLVVQWSRWASNGFGDAESAWETLCTPHADISAKAVAYGLWNAIWSQWPAAAGQFLDWQVAFKYIDQSAGSPEDGYIDKTDFATAFRLAAVKDDVFLWCQNLRAVHKSPKEAWVSIGDTDDETYGGIVYGTWATRAWKKQQNLVEDSFAYIDQDGDNVISAKEFAAVYWSCNASGPVLPGRDHGRHAWPMPSAARPIGARCFAYRPAEFDGGEHSAFGDVIAQQWSLFLLDDFHSHDPFTWDMQTGGVSWSNDQVRFHGGGRSIRTLAALYRSTGTISVSSAIVRSGACDNHFVMLSTSASERWSFRPSPTSVKFAWSCGSKYIISRNASASTACSSLGRYVLSVTLDPAGAMIFQDDHGCKDLVLEDNLGRKGEPLYLYIGGDGPPGNSSIFEDVSIKIGLNSMADSDVTPSTATACLYDGAQYEDPMSGKNGRTTEGDLSACQTRCATTAGCAHFSFQLWSNNCDLFRAGVRWRRRAGVVSGPPHCIIGIQMRIHGIDSAHLTKFQRSTLSQNMASELAMSSGLAQSTIKDASGTPGRVSLTEGKLLACGFASLPAGQSLAGVSSHLAKAPLQQGIRSSLSRVGITRSSLNAGQPEPVRVEAAVWALPAAQCMLMGTAYRPSILVNGPQQTSNVSECQQRCVRTDGCTHFSFHWTHHTCHLHNSSSTAVWDKSCIAGPRVCAALPSVLEAAPRKTHHKMPAVPDNSTPAASGVGVSVPQWVWIFLGIVALLAAVGALVKFGVLNQLHHHVKKNVPPLGQLQLPQMKQFSIPQWASMGGAAQAPQYQPLTPHDVDSRTTPDHSGPSSRASDASPVSRQTRISLVFDALDARHRNHLGVYELRRYADFCGFDGTDSDWVDEYRSMACENGWDEEAGMDRQQFQILVNDVNGKGYCTDDELAGLLDELQSETSSKGYRESHSSGQSTA